jgi:hypothetical protein
MGGSYSRHRRDWKYIENIQGKNQLEDVCGDGRIILKCKTIIKGTGNCVLHSFGSGKAPVAGCCEHCRFLTGRGISLQAE